MTRGNEFIKSIFMIKYSAILLIVFITLVSGCIEQERMIEMEKTNVSIITIYDNYEYNPELKTGWGFSCLVKTEKENILFDTGADSPTLLSNMEKLGIAPKEIDTLVLSHIHGDHTGGLAGVLDKNSNVTVYLPKSFPADFKKMVKSYSSEIVEVSNSIKISESVSTTGELGTLIKEQSLIINTENGLVVITGCAHPGIVNIVKKAKELTNENIYLVMGGFHLSGASDSEIRKIVSSFRELGVERVAPCHCSGDRTRELFEKEYKDNFIKNGVGRIIHV